MAVSKPSQVRTPLVQGRGREGGEASEAVKVILYRVSWSVACDHVAGEGACVEEKGMGAFRARVETCRWPGGGRERREATRVIQVDMCT